MPDRFADTFGAGRGTPLPRPTQNGRPRPAFVLADPDEFRARFAQWAHREGMEPLSVDFHHWVGDGNLATALSHVLRVAAEEWGAFDAADGFELIYTAHEHEHEAVGAVGVRLPDGRSVHGTVGETWRLAEGMDVLGGPRVFLDALTAVVTEANALLDSWHLQPA